MPSVLSPERAEILGFEALGWLAGDQAGLERFLMASGVSEADLRQAAGSPGLTVAILDFLLSHEDLLQAFCQATGTDPVLLHHARRLLQPSANWEA
jgi:hypothetical protein